MLVSDFKNLFWCSNKYVVLCDATNDGFNSRAGPLRVVHADPVVDRVSVSYSQKIH